MAKTNMSVKAARTTVHRKLGSQESKREVRERYCDTNRWIIVDGIGKRLFKRVGVKKNYVLA